MTQEIAGIRLGWLESGSGRPILLLHGPDPLAPDAPVLAALARAGRVMAPTHPGFGDGARPEGFETIYDLVLLYAALLDGLDAPATVIGCSFGGWLAAELALMRPGKIARLVLADALGVRFSADPLKRDILDLFNTHPRDVKAASWHDPALAPDYDTMTDAAVIRAAKSRDALCLYGWDPHMYNPRLGAWLRRIAVPTLVLWGESDRVVTPDYGLAYAAAIPGARFTLLPRAGHHPELEQPAAFAAAVLAFMEEPQ